MAQVAVPMAIAAVGGMADMKAAKAQAGGLQAQATLTRMQGRQEALKYKKQGLSVLDNILATSAAINARAGAGNIDSSSGSAMALKKYAQAKGADEYYMSREGQIITMRQAELQAIEYGKQAKAVMKVARLKAITNIAMAGYQGSLLGGAPTGGMTPTTFQQAASAQVQGSGGIYDPLAPGRF